jgi:hypothetical protein
MARSRRRPGGGIVGKRIVEAARLLAEPVVLAAGEMMMAAMPSEPVALPVRKPGRVRAAFSRLWTWNKRAA